MVPFAPPLSPLACLLSNSTPHTGDKDWFSKTWYPTQMCSTADQAEEYTEVSELVHFRESQKHREALHCSNDGHEFRAGVPFQPQQLRHRRLCSGDRKIEKEKEKEKRDQRIAQLQRSTKILGWLMVLVLLPTKCDCTVTPKVATVAVALALKSTI